MSLLIMFALLSASVMGSSVPALRLRGGANEQPKTGKVWTVTTFTREHCRFAWEMPSYFGAYLMPGRAVDPKTIESVMVTMNSINTCPYCTGLHGQLARMACTVVDQRSPAVAYAKTFAEQTGRGEQVRAAFDKLAASVGAGKAGSIRALCWALLWGKTTGNTINVARGKLVGLKWHKLTLGEVLTFVYYAPFFLVIGVLNAILTKAPTVPAWFSAIFGGILVLPQALHIVPLGLVCFALRLIAAPIGGLSL